MARARTSTRRTGRTRKTTLAYNPPSPAAAVGDPPKHGVKLKHVSTFTMLVALLCLFAYLAGRVDVSAATSVSSGEHAAQSASKGTVDTKEASMFLGLRTVKYDVQDVAKAKEWYGKVFGV